MRLFLFTPVAPATSPTAVRPAHRKGSRALLLLAAGLALPALAQVSPLQITSPNGQASLKFGFLMQPQYESLGSPTKDGDSQNLFVRRTRVLMGGSLGKDWEFFFETDAANAGKSDATGAKTGWTMSVQDAVLTWKPMKELNVDAGLVLIPFSHNSNQSAASLLSWDYLSYSFLQNTGMGTNVGRDQGVQFRGLIADHLEYRLGAFQGKRAPEQTAAAAPPNGLVQSRNAMRVAARVQYNVFDAESTMFYAGSYAGAKKILSFGIGYDKQDEYKAAAYDAFFDWPLPNKDVVTVQVDHVQYDGGTWITTLPKQSGTSAEAGYRFAALKFSPILRWEHKSYDVNTTTNLNETRVGGGIAWWFNGYNTNLKVFYNRITPDNVTIGATTTTQHNYNQFVVQLQYFIF